MFDKHIEALAQATNIFFAANRNGPGCRQFRIFIELYQSPPGTAAEIAESISAAQGTVYEDLRALGKGADRKRGAGLIEEIPPVHDRLPMRYRLSKKGQKMIEDMGFTMHCALQADEFDEENEAYFASRDLVRG